MGREKLTGLAEQFPQNELLTQAEIRPLLQVDWVVPYDEVDSFSFDSISQVQLLQAYRSLSDPQDKPWLNFGGDNLKHEMAGLKRFEAWNGIEAETELMGRIAFHKRSLDQIPNSSLHFWQRLGLRLLCKQLIRANLITSEKVIYLFQISENIAKASVQENPPHLSVMKKLNKYFAQSLRRQFTDNFKSIMNREVYMQASELVLFVSLALEQALKESVADTINNFELQDYAFGVADEIRADFVDRTAQIITSKLINNAGTEESNNQFYIIRQLETMRNLPMAYSPILFLGLNSWLAAEIQKQTSKPKEFIKPYRNIELKTILDYYLPLEKDSTLFSKLSSTQNFDYLTAADKIRIRFSEVTKLVGEVIVSACKISKGESVTNYYYPNSGIYAESQNFSYRKLGRLLEEDPRMDSIASLLNTLHPELCRGLGLSKVFSNDLKLLFLQKLGYRDTVEENASFLTGSLLKVQNTLELIEWFRILLDMESRHTWRYRQGATLQLKTRQAASNIENFPMQSTSTEVDSLHLPQEEKITSIPTANKYTVCLHMKGHVVPLYFSYGQQLPYVREKDLQSSKEMALVWLGMPPSLYDNLSSIMSLTVWHHGPNALSLVVESPHSKTHHMGAIAHADWLREAWQSLEITNQPKDLQNILKLDNLLLQSLFIVLKLQLSSMQLNQNQTHQLIPLENDVFVNSESQIVSDNQVESA